LAYLLALFQLSLSLPKITQIIPRTIASEPTEKTAVKETAKVKKQYSNI
jgi:hypothetical protein